jgi:hypothetical protein
MSIALRTPPLPDYVRQAVENALRDLHVSLPGQIESYDVATQTAKVKPLVQERASSDDVVLDLPVLEEVPVVFPRAGGVSLTFGVKKGDQCLLVFSERSLDQWLANGGVVDPLDSRHHHLTDAVALMGLHDSKSAIGAAASSGARLGADGGKPELLVAGTDITINVDAGAHINLVVGTGGTVNLGGAGGVAIAVDKDLAGPYPVQALQCMTVKAKVGP